MKEAYIENKVYLMNNLLSDGTLERLNKEREIANIMNRFHKEMTHSLKEHEGRMIRFAEQLLRDNI